MDELPCDIAGQCEAPQNSRGITNCIHCGKELVEKDGEWWTWDADLFPTQKPQGVRQ
jgi:hypothetical protein